MFYRLMSSPPSRRDNNIVALWIVLGAVVGLTVGWIVKSYLVPLILAMLAATFIGIMSAHSDESD
jgi:predicted PurR-regulated permease PerM